MGDRRTWWVVVAALIIGSGMAVGLAGSWGSPGAAQRVAVASELSGPLAAQLMTSLEAAPGWTEQEADKPKVGTYCGVDVFGVEPAGARSVDEVTTVYAWTSCESRSTADGSDELETSGMSGSAVAHLRPLRWDFPEDGNRHAASIHRLFPRALWDEALTGDRSARHAERRLQERLSRLPG